MGTQPSTPNPDPGDPAGRLPGKWRDAPLPAKAPARHPLDGGRAAAPEDDLFTGEPLPRAGLPKRPPPKPPLGSPDPFDETFGRRPVARIGQPAKGRGEASEAHPPGTRGGPARAQSSPFSLLAAWSSTRTSRDGQEGQPWTACLT